MVSPRMLNHVHQSTKPTHETCTEQKWTHQGHSFTLESWSLPSKSRLEDIWRPLWPLQAEKMKHSNKIKNQTFSRLCGSQRLAVASDRVPGSGHSLGLGLQKCWFLTSNITTSIFKAAENAWSWEKEPLTLVKRKMCFPQRRAGEEPKEKEKNTVCELS